jgi:hypothetical protein
MYNMHVHNKKPQFISLTRNFKGGKSYSKTKWCEIWHSYSKLHSTKKKLKIVVVNLQCVVLIQESQQERDDITQKVRKDHDNIKRPNKCDNI